MVVALPDFFNQINRVCLSRLLRARKWEVSAAKQLGDEIIAYRADNKIDDILARTLGDQKLQDPSNGTRPLFTARDQSYAFRVS